MALERRADFQPEREISLAKQQLEGDPAKQALDERNQIDGRARRPVGCLLAANLDDPGPLRLDRSRREGRQNAPALPRVVFALGSNDAVAQSPVGAAGRPEAWV